MNRHIFRVINGAERPVLPCVKGKKGGRGEKRRKKKKKNKRQGSKLLIRLPIKQVRCWSLCSQRKSGKTNTILERSKRRGEKRKKGGMEKTRNGGAQTCP